MRAKTSQHGSTQLTANLRVLVCREMCIPGNAQLSLTLPIKSQSPAPAPSATELFTVVRKSLPRPLPANWKLSVAQDKDSFSLTATLGHQTTQAIFFPLIESQIPVREPQLIRLPSRSQGLAMIFDAYRALEFLVTQPHIDANRLRCLVFQIGGFATLHLCMKRFQGYFVPPGAEFGA